MLYRLRVAGVAALKPAADGQAQAKLKPRYRRGFWSWLGRVIVQSVLLCPLPTLIVTEAFAGRRRFALVRGCRDSHRLVHGRNALHPRTGSTAVWVKLRVLADRRQCGPIGMSCGSPLGIWSPCRSVQFCRWGFLGFRRIRDLRAAVAPIGIWMSARAVVLSLRDSLGYCQIRLSHTRCSACRLGCF